MSNRQKAYLLLLATAIIWGMASPVIKFTLFQIKPFAFLFWRFFITCLIFLPAFVIIARREKESLLGLLRIAPLGILGITLTLSFIFLGLERTTALDASVLVAIAPIFICVAGVLFLKEKITRLEMIGITLAFTGTIIMIAQPLLEGTTFAARNLIGNLLIIISNLAWTAYVILSKEEFKKHSPFIITATSFFTGLLTILPLALAEQGINLFHYQPLLFSSGAIWGVIYMSLFSSVIAYFTFALGLRLIEASEASLFAYLQPIFAAPLAVFWLGEKITFPFILGASIIVLGIFLAEASRFGPKNRAGGNSPTHHISLFLPPLSQSQKER